MKSIKYAERHNWRASRHIRYNITCCTAQWHFSRSEVYLYSTKSRKC